MSREVSQAAARSLTALLAPTLGWDRGAEAVNAAIRRLRLPEDDLQPGDVEAILEELALDQGLVGVTARIVRSKTPSSRPAAEAGSSDASSRPPDAGPPSPAELLVTTLGVHEIVSQLAPMLGPDKTEPAVVGAVRRLGLPRDRLDRDQAARLLDELVRQDGLVGMTARFVRARVMALFNG